MNATFTDFLTNMAEDALTAGSTVTLVAIGGASTNVIGWNFGTLAGAFAAGAIISVLTSFAKRDVGAKNQTTIVPAIDPGLAPRHLA